MTDIKNSSTLTSEQLKSRIEREAQRGRVRDENGKIVFSKEQLEERIAHFQAKKEDYKKRQAKIEVEIKKAEELLKTK